MPRKQLQNGGVRVQIDSFGKLNRSKHPTKLEDNEFYTKENLINKVGSYGSIERRNGLQRYNGNVLTASSVINLYEAKLSDAYYLLGKDNAGAGSSSLKYVASPYTGAWSSVVTNEYAGYYNFEQFKNSIYIANRLDGSGNRLQGKVWQGSTNYYEHGCIPSQIGDGSGVTSIAQTTGGFLTLLNYYCYIVTFLYDGFQESSTFIGNWKVLTGSNNAFVLTSTFTGRVRAVKVYRSIANGTNIRTFPEYFYFIGTINTSGDTLYDGKADSDLAGAIPSENFFNAKRPYQSKYVAVANDSLIQANLQTDSTNYSAITGSNITLSIGGGGTLGHGTYKYRFFKAYAQHSGGRYVYVLGDYVEKSISNPTGAKIGITLNVNDGIVSNKWVRTMFIQRTVVGGSDFHNFPPLLWAGVSGWEADKYDFVAGIYDDFSDALLLSYNDPTSGYQMDIIYAKDLIYNQFFKGSLSISESGNGDLVPSESVKVIDVKNSRGITGLFQEDSRMIIFTPSAIYYMDIRPLDSTFWTIDKIIDGIGASGQNSSPNAETIGHSGILQLPNGAGYIFFNRAVSASALTPINIYYWDGQGEPVAISNEIFNYINGYSTFIVKGMCFDFVRKWVWMNIVTATTKIILIYDLNKDDTDNFLGWYVFNLDSSLNFYDIICTEDGKILLGCDAGYVNAYTDATYKDTYGATPTNTAYTSKLITKTFDEENADINVNQIQVAVDSSTADLSLTQLITSTDQNGTDTYTPKDYSNSGATIHRTRGRTSTNCRRFFLTLSNATNDKNMIIHQIDIDYKILHSEVGGII